MHQMRIKGRGLIIAGVLGGLLIGPTLGVQSKLFAQQTSPPASPDVSKELEAMKKRIEQLEAEAKARESNATKPPDPVAAKPDFPTLKPSETPTLPTRSAPVDVATTTSPDPTPQAPATPPPAAPAPPAPVDLATPFAFADFTWMNAVPRNNDEVLDGKYFSGEVRTDINYIYDYWHPIDHSLGGTTEGERTGEFVLQQANVGGDFHAGAMQMRFLTQIGATATAVPRNDASYSVGQWQLNDAYRYITEAYAGYHMDKAHGLNFQAGIFMSYIGLFSFYSFDNWAYQPSYVSSNTPWFFSGFRIQCFPTNKLKIEPWFINGWQTYAKYNGHPGVGGQILWRPTANTDFVWNHYLLGTDALGVPNRHRYHADYSQEWKYWENKSKGMDRMAITFTEDFGCESGGGVQCTHGKLGSSYRRKTSPASWLITAGGSTKTGSPPLSAAASSTILAAIWFFCRRSTAPRQPAVRLTSRRTRAISSGPMITSSLSIGCRASGSHGVPSLRSAAPTFPTLPDRAA